MTATARKYSNGTLVTKSRNVTFVVGICVAFFFFFFLSRFFSRIFCDVIFLLLFKVLVLHLHVSFQIINNTIHEKERFLFFVFTTIRVL